MLGTAVAKVTVPNARELMVCSDPLCLFLSCRRPVRGAAALLSPGPWSSAYPKSGQGHPRPLGRPSSGALMVSPDVPSIRADASGPTLSQLSCDTSHQAPLKISYVESVTTVPMRRSVTTWG